MKRIIILAILLVSGIFANAQSYDNRTTCNVVITPFCYIPNNPCSVISTCPPITVGPGQTGTLPVCNCDHNGFVGYTVCWGDSPCTGVCVSVIPPTSPCPTIPSSAILPKCGQCSNRTGGNATVSLLNPSVLMIQ